MCVSIGCSIADGSDITLGKEKENLKLAMMLRYEELLLTIAGVLGQPNAIAVSVLYILLTDGSEF